MHEQKGSSHTICTTLDCKCHTQPTVYLQGGSSISLVSRLKNDFDQPLPTTGWGAEFEALALTEPNPNQAVFNLPLLKELISRILAQREDEIVEMFEKIQEARKKAGTIDDYILLEEVITRIKERNV